MFIINFPKIVATYYIVHITTSVNAHMDKENIKFNKQITKVIHGWLDY